MSAATTIRPASGEYPPYTINYISLVPDGDIVATLGKQLDDTLALVRSISESRGDFRYEEGKWSIKEVIGHLIDGERIFAYRALRFARGDETPLSGFEQDDYVRNGGFDKRTLSDLANEYEHVRRSTIALFSNLDEEAWARLGSANDNPASVRALAFMIAGHVFHHIEILRSRYLE
ncbi:MAG TPA: DinB family protein [Blastocatellia bacterium]|nr:DinB family protein [Blastocatellia bacterium]